MWYTEKNNNVMSGITNIANTGVGMGFVDNGGAGSLVENNIITNNNIGVEYNTPGGDMGGGSAGSSGGNIISCNSRNDFWTVSTITVFAENNLWDNAPPNIETTQTDSGIDIFNRNGSATINTTGAGISTTPCP